MMRIRSQVGMVLNLDQCIGCHTCSVTCRNVWTSREGMAYAWFNNVETRPGIGYPKEWENQHKGKGGWLRREDGAIEPRIGGRFRVLARLFSNPELPEIDDYYEPFDFDYQHLHRAGEGKHQPVARPRSLISGQRSAVSGQRSAVSACKRSSGARTGKRFWAPSLKSAARTGTSITPRPTSTGSLKTPS